MEKLLHFLETQDIAVLSVRLPDNTVHGATVHFSHSTNDNSLKLFFATKKSSRKAEGLREGATTAASVVIGFSTKEWLTAQLDGTLQSVSNPADIGAIKSIHYAKHPSAKKFEGNPDSVFLEFIPTWWRYSDFNSKPPSILGSEQQ